MIIAGILKELALWVHGIFVEILSYFANALLEILNMDTAVSLFQRHRMLPIILHLMTVNSVMPCSATADLNCFCS